MGKAKPPAAPPSPATIPSRQSTDDLIADALDVPNGDMLFSNHEPSRVNTTDLIAQASLRPERMNTDTLIDMAVAPSPSDFVEGHALAPVSLPPAADLLLTGTIPRLRSLPRASARGGFSDGQLPRSPSTFPRSGLPQDGQGVSVSAPALDSSATTLLPLSRYLAVPSPPTCRVSLGEGLGHPSQVGSLAQPGGRLSSGSTDAATPGLDPADTPPKVDRNSPGYQKMSLRSPRTATADNVSRSSLVAATLRPDTAAGAGIPNSGRWSPASPRVGRASRPRGRRALSPRAVAKPPPAGAEAAPPPVDRSTDYYKTWSPRFSRRGQQPHTQPVAGPLPPKVAIP